MLSLPLVVSAWDGLELYLEKLVEDIIYLDVSLGKLAPIYSSTPVV